MTPKALFGALICLTLAASLTIAQSGEKEKDKAQSKLDQLREQRLAACHQLAGQTNAMYLSGQATFLEKLQAEKPRFEAELEMAGESEKGDVYRRELARRLKAEEIVHARYESGTAGPAEHSAAIIARLEIEIELAKLESGK